MAMIQSKQSFQISGMDCAGCARSIETGVSQLAGVERCQINFTTEKMQVVGDVAPETVVSRVRELGFEVVDTASAEASTIPTTQSTGFFPFMWSRTETRLALLGALLILPGLIFEELLQLHHIAINVSSVAALTVAGLPIARSAWRAISVNREININVLMTLASIGAVLIGAFTEAAMVMVLFAIGEALEGYTANRARNAIRSLVAVMPNRATRLTTQAGRTIEEQLDIADLRIGDVIVVKPGQKIPMDGRVLAGLSSVNQAAITGESRLIEKGADDEVFASTINGEGTLEIEVTGLAVDNVISRLIQMVEAAQEKRAPAQRFVDRFAKYYTPAVVVLAVLVAAIPPLFFGQPFLNPDPDTFGWLYRGLALLVVACPCALVISTPVSIVSAISNAARNGVLVKGGVYLESLSKIKTIAFDKTGTLTNGQPAVVAVRSVGCVQPLADSAEACIACDDVVALASSVEQRSEHPLAQAIIQEASGRQILDKYPAAAMVTALTGRGVTGQVSGREVVVGSHAYFDATVPHSDIHCDEANDDASQGHTPLMVGSGGTYLGTITVADKLRASSPETVRRLRQTGIENMVMLTGDNREVAQSIGEAVGITDVRANLLPEDKVNAVNQLRQEYGPIAMIGDGINDAPALATATVGIALAGTSGTTTQAMETADITLLGDNLHSLPFAFRLSQTTMQTIRTNIGLSLGIKLLFLVLVLLGTGTMWMAVLADVGTSLLVTLNGMRLLRRPNNYS